MQKTALLTLPDSPHPVISLLVKVLDFGHFVSLDRMNSVFSFNTYKNILFSLFWLLASARQNLAFARKIMVLPKSGGLQPLSSPGSYAYDYSVAGRLYSRAYWPRGGIVLHAELRG